MVKRIFLAVNIPSTIKTALEQWQHALPSLPIRWTPKENMHITLLFLGNTSEKELQELTSAAVAIAKKHRPFLVKFSRIEYGPNTKNPRMVWVRGSSQRLCALQTDLKRESGAEENTPFSLHVTLGRLNEFEFRQLELEERPAIYEKINLHFAIDSFEIMESNLKRFGAEYTRIKSFALAY